MIVCPLSAIAISALIAPRLQLFTNLVCKELDSRQWDPAGATTPHRVGFVSTTRPVPCAADPVVQANVTKLLTGACYSALVRFSCSSHVASLVMATVQGVLSCLTAAFWGSVRFPTLIVAHLAKPVAVLGPVRPGTAAQVQYHSCTFSRRCLRNACRGTRESPWGLPVSRVHVCVGRSHRWSVSALASPRDDLESLPRIFRWDSGIPGVYCRLQRTWHKVCMPPIRSCRSRSKYGFRSRIFSRIHGLLFAGLALGPTIGGLTEHLSGKPYVVFYIALGSHAIIAFLYWFIAPESLLPAQMDAARRAKRASNKGYFSSWLSGFFAPLTVFAPVTQQKDGVTPQKSIKKDWSLTWLAFSFAPESLVLGGGLYSLQYAVGKYNWTGEMVRLVSCPLRVADPRIMCFQLGYYISIAAGARALYLALGLPGEFSCALHSALKYLLH